MTDLKLAAQAVLDRWDSPKWEWHKQGPTADLMADLRSALQHQEEREPQTIAVPIEAYRWLMGMGNDAFIPDRQGAFWWRGKFNELAGLDVRDYMGLSTPPLLQKEEGDGKEFLRELRQALWAEHLTGLPLLRQVRDELIARLDAAIATRQGEKPSV